MRGFVARNSDTAHAMLRPSKVDVPRPISSSTTRLRDVAWWRMFAVSCISTMNVDCPRAMLSDAPTRAKMRSTIASLASRAGTNDPACAMMHVGFDVVVDGRDLAERREDVECRERARGRLNPRRFGRDSRDQTVEDLEFALEDALVGAEHLLFVLFERRRDEALTASDRLLAVIVARHRAKIRLRHLDVVAEHAVVADLQRSDPGPRTLVLLHLGDDLLAGAADRSQFVELAIDAVACEAAVACEDRRVFDQGRFNRVAQVGKVVELGDERFHERR